MLRSLFGSMAFVFATLLIAFGGAPSSHAIALPKPALQKPSSAGGDNLVHQVHGWHCRRRYGPVRICRNGYCRTVYRWHRHPRACYGGGYYGPSINLYIAPRYRSAGIAATTGPGDTTADPASTVPGSALRGFTGHAFAATSVRACHVACARGYATGYGRGRATG